MQRGLDMNAPSLPTESISIADLHLAEDVVEAL